MLRKSTYALAKIFCEIDSKDPRVHSHKSFHSPRGAVIGLIVTLVLFTHRCPAAIGTSHGHCWATWRGSTAAVIHVDTVLRRGLAGSKTIYILDRLHDVLILFPGGVKFQKSKVKIFIVVIKSIKFVFTVFKENKYKWRNKNNRQQNYKITNFWIYTKIKRQQIEKVDHALSPIALPSGVNSRPRLKIITVEIKSMIFVFTV